MDYGRVATEDGLNEFVCDFVEVNFIIFHVTYIYQHRDGSVNHMHVEFEPYIAHWKYDGDHAERYFLSNSKADKRSLVSLMLGLVPVNMQ